jgi:hypothetical protein
MENYFAWTFTSRFERGAQWYLIFATIIITIILASFLLGYFLLGIVLILFAGVYLLFDINTHPEVRVIIKNDGVSINEELYSYTRMKSFGIVRADNQPILLRIKLMSKAVSTLDLYLDPVLDIEALRLFMNNYIPEDTTVEMSLMERILLGLKL